MPIDASTFSKSAVDFVASRATLLKSAAHVELVNVQIPVSARVSHALGTETVESYYSNDAERILKPAAARLRSAGADVTARHVVGTIRRDLVEVVDGSAADLVVMGSHGDTGLTKLLLGSVAGTVAVSCTRPLLIVRDAPTPKKDSLEVGIALDGSPYAIQAARFVARHRDLFGAEPAVTLIHVVPDVSRIVVHGLIDREVDTGIKPAQAQAMQNAAFESVFAPVREILGAAGLDASEARLVGSDPGDLIAAHATQAKFDLLAMGSLGFGTDRFSALGSVAARVASRCRQALLLVREKS